MPFINNGGGGGGVPTKILDISSGAYGLINGVNTLFTLPSRYLTGTLGSSWDAVLQAPGYVSITETDAAAGTFTFGTPPATGTKIIMFYGAVV